MSDSSSSSSSDDDDDGGASDSDSDSDAEIPPQQKCEFLHIAWNDKPQPNQTNQSTRTATLGNRKALEIHLFGGKPIYIVHPVGHISSVVYPPLWQQKPMVWLSSWTNCCTLMGRVHLQTPLYAS